MLGACEGSEDLLGSLDGSEETEGCQKAHMTCLGVASPTCLVIARESKTCLVRSKAPRKPKDDQREQTTCLDPELALMIRFEYRLAEVK